MDILMVVIAIMVIIIGMIGGLALYAKRYVRVPPNMAMVVFGRASGNAGYKIIRGGGQFIVPIFEDYSFLPLNVRTLNIDVKDIRTDISGRKIKMHLTGAAQVKIASDEASLATAAEVLLNKKDDEINEMALKTIEGHIRGIFTSMTVEAIDGDRDELARSIQFLVDKDLKNMGMAILSFVIKEAEPQTGASDASKGQDNAGTEALVKEILARISKIETRIEKIEKKMG
jgi:flotillin